VTGPIYTAWPTVDDVISSAGLSAAAASDALDDALAAGTAECRRLAPRRFTDTGPDGADAWLAVCQAAALEFRGRGGASSGYPDQPPGSEPVGDGWQGVRRLLGTGYYSAPRVG
jgi:hypothetical protein